MSFPKHSILPVAESDVSFLADHLHKWKLSMTLNRLLFKDWPNDAAQKPMYWETIRSTIANETIEDLNMIDDESGEIVGYVALARIQPKPMSTEETPKKSRWEKEKESISDCFNHDLRAANLDVAIGMSQGLENTDRYEIAFLFIVPSQHRRGLGSQLVKVCVERAKAKGLPLLTCSDPVAYEFFSRVGFRHRKHVDLDLAKWAPPHSGFGVFRFTGMIWQEQ